MVKVVVRGSTEEMVASKKWQNMRWQEELVKLAARVLQGVVHVRKCC